MRKRFTADERASFTPGTVVQVRNVSQWHDGVITGPIVQDGPWQAVPVEITKSKGTVDKGERFNAMPTAVRLPS